MELTLMDIKKSNNLINSKIKYFVYKYYYIYYFYKLYKNVIINSISQKYEYIIIQNIT